MKRIRFDPTSPSDVLFPFFPRMRRTRKGSRRKKERKFNPKLNFLFPFPLNSRGGAAAILIFKLVFFSRTETPPLDLVNQPALIARGRLAPIHIRASKKLGNLSLFLDSALLRGLVRCTLGATEGPVGKYLALQPLLPLSPNELGDERKRGKKFTN